ncbi:MAG: VOC family protein [Alphaproteobacteria bacterium]|nr:VOC family protein [Alphaproteobacteria bacterium]
MIVGLDRVRASVGDLAGGAVAVARLLGRSGFVGEENATFALDNIALDLSLSEGGVDGLTGLAFEVAIADVAYRVCQRRALSPQPPVAFAEADGTALREGRHVELDPDATFGVQITLVEYAGKPATQPSTPFDGAVTGLDHVVIRTTHPNRAAALYGARLGLDMRLDRTEPKWGARLMFFRCGDLIVEVVHNLNEEPSDAPDKLWGLSWRVANAEAAHARLSANGFDLSEIRTGRKPGTRVFTVRNNTLGVPTLIVEVQQGRGAAA